MPDVPAERAHKGPRQVQSQTSGCGALLEGLEQVLGLGDAESLIDEPNHNAVLLRGQFDDQFSGAPALHRALAVLHQV